MLWAQNFLQFLCIALCCLILTQNAVCQEILIRFPCIRFYETVVLWGVTYGWIDRHRILWTYFAVLCKSWKTEMSTAERSVRGRVGDCYRRAMPAREREVDLCMCMVSLCGIGAATTCLVFACIAWCWNTGTAFVTSDRLWIFLSILQFSASLFWIWGASCTKYRPSLCSCPCTAHRWILLRFTCVQPGQIFRNGMNIVLGLNIGSFCDFFLNYNVWW